MAAERASAGLIRLALAFALVLAGLALVVRRQSRALELVRAVERARMERTVAEAQRAALLERIDWLQSRDRITAVVARDGMRLPTGSEIEILPETALPATAPAPAGAGAMAAR